MAIITLTFTDYGNIEMNIKGKGHSRIRLCDLSEKAQLKVLVWAMSQSWDFEIKHGASYHEGYYEMPVFTSKGRGNGHPALRYWLGEYATQQRPCIYV